jgi:glycosyltransferase involved in cell wall biosynthesis
MRDETILCISPRGWHTLWRSTQQIMSRLARQNRVLFIEPGRFAYSSALSELVRHLPDYVLLRPEVITDNLIVIPTPSSLPHARRLLPPQILRYSMPLIIQYNASLLVRQVKRAMQALAVVDPILWLYSPYQRDLIGQFNEKLVCYYVYDEYSAFTHNARIKALLEQYDRDVARRADVVFASSRAQYEHRQPFNPHTYFVPNAADFDLFRRGAENGPLPPDIRNLPRPVFGFVGWLGYSLDVSLIVKTASAYSNASIVLVGPDHIPPTPASHQLHQMPNVHFLGEKPREQLPDYLRAFDVGLLPFVLEGHMLAAYPLKLHEYLAAGLAVVSTDLTGTGSVQKSGPHRRLA